MLHAEERASAKALRWEGTRQAQPLWMWKESEGDEVRGGQGPELGGLTDHGKEFTFIVGVMGNLEDGGN